MMIKELHSIYTQLTKEMSSAKLWLEKIGWSLCKQTNNVAIQVRQGFSCAISGILGISPSQ